MASIKDLHHGLRRALCSRSVASGLHEDGLCRLEVALAAATCKAQLLRRASSFDIFWKNFPPRKSKLIHADRRRAIIRQASRTDSSKTIAGRLGCVHA